MELWKLWNVDVAFIISQLDGFTITIDKMYSICGPIEVFLKNFLFDYVSQMIITSVILLFVLFFLHAVS